MAIVKCRECGSKISSEAKACPQCGATKKRRTLKVLLGILALLLFVVYLNASSSDHQAKKTKNLTLKEGGEADDLRKKEKQENADKEIERHSLIASAKNALKERLREPDSAEFKNVIIVTYQDKLNVVCGEVNAKNGFGGMTGFQPFVSLGSAQMTWLPTDSKTFADDWNKYCAGRQPQ